MTPTNFATATVIRIFRAFIHLRLIPQFLLFLLVCLSLMWGVISIGLFQLRTTAERESFRDVSNVSQLYAQEVNSTIETIDLSLIGLRGNWLRNRQDFPEIVSNLENMLKDKLIFQIAVTDARGIMAFSSVDRAAGALDLSDREHIRVHLKERSDKLFISKAVLGRVSKKWSVQFTRPIYAADGQFKGVIVASIAPTYLSRFYKQIDLGEGAFFQLARTDGAILADSRRATESVIQGSTLTGPAFDRHKGATVGRFKSASEIDGVERFFAWQYLVHNGLVVIVGQSVDDAYAAYSSQRNIYLGAAVIGPILLALLSWFALQAARVRHRTAKALASAESLWKFALEGGGDGVWDWDYRRQSATLSRRAMTIYQVDSETLPCTAEALRSRVHPEDGARVNQALLAHFEGKTSTYVVEYRVKARDSGWTWILARGIVVARAKDGKPKRMVGTISEISDRKAKEEMITHQSQHDWLTGLPNRLLLTDRLRQALIRAHRDATKLAVIYFDLDKFKPVNDTYGHEVGDNLLKAVAERLSAGLRGSDSISRVGGDEFVVLLPHVSEEADSFIVASEILALLNRTFEVDGHQLQISGSIGIATYPTDGKDETSLLRSADRAMYQAKADGHNQIQIHNKDVKESGPKWGQPKIQVETAKIGFHSNLEAHHANDHRSPPS